MLELTYVSLLLMAFLAAGFGLAATNTAQLLAYPVSMVLFATVAYGSYGVQPSFGSGDPANHTGIFVLGIGGMLVMLIFWLGASIEALPRVGGDDMPSTGEVGTMQRMKNTLNGNKKL